MKRNEILKEAGRLISEDRAKQYGDFRENYQKVALFAQAVTGKEISPGEALLFMVGTKLARESTRHKMDNIIDAIGYLALYGEWCATGTTLETLEIDTVDGLDQYCGFNDIGQI